MSLVGGYIFPHPPIILPEIGRGEEKKAQNTIDGVKFLANEIGNVKPDTIIVITPHGPVFQDAVCISSESELYGDMRRFGQPNIKFEFKNNIELAEKISKYASLDGIIVGQVDKNFAKQYKISTDIDHGALVPLYFVNSKYLDYKLVHISIGLLPYEDLFRFGKCIDRAIKEYDGNAVVIASSDLSHRLSIDAPAGYNERGKEFDKTLVDLIKNYDVENIFKIDENLIECAGECGFRPITMLLGVMDGYNVKSSFISYEGPYGVGYATAKFDIVDEKKESLYEKLIENVKHKLQNIRAKEDEYVKLARLSIETYIRNNEILDIPPNTSQELVDSEAGVFVSIKKHSQLRGCIGTIGPTRDNIAEEIIYNAISAGTKDPRFYPIEEDELNQLVYSVDILKKPEPITSKTQLDVKRYGVIVKKGNRSGLLLPNLEGVDTIDEQISIALSKAGIGENENYSMERFEVIRHGTK